ncbi:MAG: ABC transporter ATP-binding protein [Anaerolineae bacterium]
MSTPLLSFQDVTFQYLSQSHPALHQLSLDIHPGTVTAILGPNGAGKTTLLYLALGWLKPQSGQVALNGRPLSAYSRGDLGRWMGLVPQSEHIPFEYSLLEYVLLGRAPYLKTLEMPGPQDCQIASQALEQVGLGGWEARPITQLSGGERQLLLVARALAQEPRLLVLDEPTSHLDLSNKLRLLTMLRELNDRQVTIMLTTHEPEVVAAVATYLVLMRDGQVLHTGPLAETFTSQNLSATYGMTVQVTQVDGRQIALWV